MENKRVPWEFGRFLKTARFYGALKPKIPVVSRIIERRKRAGEKKRLDKSDILWSQESTQPG